MQSSPQISALQRARSLRERLLDVSPEALPAWVEEALPWPGSPPTLADDTPEANLLEDLLLAFAALKRPVKALPEATQALLSSIASPQPNERLRLCHRVVERDEQARIEPALAAALVRGEGIGATQGSDICYILNNKILSKSQTTAIDILRSPLRLLAYHPESLPAVLTASQSTRQQLLLLQPPASFVHFYALSEAELLRRAVSAPLPTDRVGASAELLQYSLQPTEGRRFDRTAEAEARLVDLLALLDAPADDGTRFEVAALSAALLLLPPEPTLRLDLMFGAGHAIARALLASPFFGADPLLLAARLSASAHEARARLTPSGPRPTLPFGAGDGDLRPHWPALRAALAEVPRLSLPVREALLTLARRAATPAERDASARRSQTIGWNSPQLGDAVPIEPPMFARWLLHRHKQPWITTLDELARAELAQHLESSAPEETAWIMTALPQRGRWSEELEDRLTRAWVHLRSQIVARPGALRPDWLEPWCLWGTSLLARLPEPDALALVGMAEAEVSQGYRAGLLKLIADNAPSLPVRAAAAEALLRLLVGPDRALRPPAGVALLLLLRAGALDNSWRTRVGEGLTAELRRHPNLVDLVRYADPR